MNERGLLLLPHLQVQNANAISGPLSWGFPPPATFLGFAHALERRMRNTWDMRFSGVGIVCHRFTPLTTRPNRRRYRVFNLMRHPVRAGYKKWQDKNAALIEEGRARMEISLLLECEADLDADPEEYLEQIAETVRGMRLAGGSILPMRGSAPRPLWLSRPKDDMDIIRQLRRRLLPGFALVHRPDLLTERLNQLRELNPEADALDALLDLSALHVEPTAGETGRVHWQYQRAPGWMVPLPIGYSGLTGTYRPGQVAHARDEETPFRFVESIYSLGQWISPHRIHQPGQLMWRYQTDEPNGLYLCANDYATTLNKE